MVLESQSRSQRKTTAINDILAWCQAFTSFMVVLLAADATTKEQAAGLADPATFQRPGGQVVGEIRLSSENEPQQRT